MVAGVTFEPGARTGWHTHPLGVIIGLLGMACVVGGLVWATPTVGLLVGTILSFGTSGARISEQLHVALPPVISASGEKEDGGDWEASVHANGPSNVIVQDVVYAPNGHTGWHSHPGILLSSVVAGSIEWYDSKCKLHLYNAGDSFTESTQLQYVAMWERSMRISWSRT